MIKHSDNFAFTLHSDIILLRIQGALDSYLDQDDGYSDWGPSYFSRFLQVNASIAGYSKIRSRL
jgi:hypothetical protein